MPNITWRVESMVWDLETGGVNTVHWRIIASDDTNTVDAYGSMGFSPDPESDNFISLDNLTEENVILWLKSNEELGNVESSLIDQLEKKNNPVTESGLPWIINEQEKSDNV